MSSIGEKIKDKLHIGRSANDEGHNTMTHNSTKTTTTPGTATTGTHVTSGVAGSTVGSGTHTTTTGTHSGTGMGTHTGGGIGNTTGTGMHAHTGTGMGSHTTTPGYNLDHAHNKTHAKGMSVPNSTTRTTTETHTGGAATTGKACDTKYYSTIEDRPVEKEIIERVVEHHPVEKKFVVETRPAGEHELTHQRKDESLGVREEIKRVAPKSSPCEGGPKLEVL